MRFFKRKKTGKNLARYIICPHCGSSTTFPDVPGYGGASFNVKSWRGQRYLERRCRDCGRSFYADAPTSGGTETYDDQFVDDEDALRLAEEELKRQLDSDSDHRYKPPGR